MKATEKKQRRKKPQFKIFNKSNEQPLIDRKAFCGSIKLKIDPLEYQKKIRNEWE